MQMKNTEIRFTQEPSKLYVHLSNHCESKIRTACQQFPDREWSGAAFYKVKYLHGKNVDNAVLPNDIALEVVDFMLQDIGNAVYTEYDLNEEVAGYIADNLDELLGTKVALLHSHNKMAK